MKKSNKIIMAFYVFLGVSSISAFLYIDSQYPEFDLKIVPDELNKLSYTTETEIDKIKIFNVMTDVSNYPKILPKNVESIKIIEYGENFIIAEEIYIERGIRITSNIKHTIIPYETHVVEILDGDAKGTQIVQTFLDEESYTKIVSELELDFKGLLSPFVFIPKSNFLHALDTIHSSFILYAQNYDDSFKQKVDDLYREILLRPADLNGLKHYSSLLKDGDITENELKQILLDSEERMSLQNSSTIISINDLKPETKKIVNDIYNKMLQRDVDLDGLLFFGTSLENGTMSISEIENFIFESEEGTRIRLDTWAKQQINDSFIEILSRPATLEELNYYEPLIQTKEISEDDLKVILANNTIIEITKP